MSITLLHPMPIMAIEDTKTEDEEILEIPEPEILSEDVSQRTQYSKDFIMSNKTTQTIIYPIPVHYDNDGTLEEIDNTLVDDGITAISEDSDEVEGYKTSKSKTKIKFSKKMHKKNLGSIKLDDYKITWGFENFDNKSEATIISNNEQEDPRLKIYEDVSQTVVYEDIMDNISLRYSIDSLNIKEDIIIKEKVDIDTFTFNYKTKNLILSLNDNGEIEARDSSTDEVIFIMPKPYMKDTDGRISEEVSYTLNQEDENKYTITITADSEWMNDEDRVYPIIIDPVIQTKQDRSYFDTTFITQNIPSQNYGGRGELLVGNESSEYHACRALIKFTLPDLNKGDMIVDARMVLYGYTADATDVAYDLKINAHMITTAWTYNSVTWNTRPSFETVVQDYDHATRTENDQYYGKVFDITNAVKRWYEGDATNNGILLKASKETTEDWNHYDFKFQFANENSTGTNVLYPYISLTFRNNKGIEGYWDYTSINNDDGDNISINNYSGNAVITHTDASTYGDMPVTVQHIYNGYQAGKQVENVRPYAGKGFKLNIQQTIRPSSEYGLTGESAEKYPYVYMDADGTLHYFMDTDDGMIDEDGLGLKLTRNPDSSVARFTITDKSKNKMTFNWRGCLKTISNAKGDTLTVYYEPDTNIIDYAVDSEGKQINIMRYADYSLSSITDAASRITSFTYDDNGRLTTISKKYDKDSDGNYKQTTFAYDSAGSITQINSHGSRYFKLTYTAASKGKRVASISEYSTGGTLGQTIKFSRTAYNVTTVTTSGVDNIIDTDDDIITRMEFDNYGRLKSTSSSSNGSRIGAATVEFSKGEAEEDSEAKGLNRLNKVAGLSPYTENLLKNHGGESTTGWTTSTTLGTTTHTFTSSSNYALFGQKSFRLNVTESSTDGRARFYQQINDVSPNTTYTFSAYIRTVGLSEVEGQENGGALLYVYVDDGAGNDKSFTSEYITLSTDLSINNGWRRVYVTFTTTAEVTYVRVSGMVRGATGNAYFDGLQLERGKSYSDYNLVENSSFERVTDSFPDNWNGNELTSNDVSTTARYSNGSRSFMIEPGDAPKYIYQDIPVSGSEDDTYVLSGWSYGKGKTEDESLVRYRLAARITYSDGSTVWKSAAAVFNTGIGVWKYSNATFDLSDGTTAEKTPTKIRVVARAHRQPNNIYFDSIQLTRSDTTIFDYDDNGNLIKEGDKKYTYESNKLKTEYDGIDTTNTYTYTTNDRIKSITTSFKDGTADIVKNYQYVTTDTGIKKTILDIIADDLKIKTSTQHQNGLLIKEYDADGRSTSYAYDDENKGLLQTITSPNESTLSYGYDTHDRLISIKRMDGETDLKTVELAYDDSDRIIKLKTGNTTYNFTYNGFNQLKTIKVGSQVLTTRTYFEKNGGLRMIELGDSTIYEYVYDIFGNVVTTKKNGTAIETRKYDKNGTLIEINDLIKDTKTQYDFDVEGRLSRIDEFDTSKTAWIDKWMHGQSFSYDEHDRIDKVKTRKGDINTNAGITYQDGSYIESYQINTDRNISYEYDSLKRLTKRTINTTSPISIEYTYAGSARGTDYTTNKIKTETIGDITYTYKYEKIGNITSIKDETNNKEIVYYYDKDSQLVRENNQILDKIIRYEYDKNGNMTSRKEYDYATDTLQETIAYSYGNTWKDQLTSFNGQTISYDVNGNPTTYLGNSLTWNGRELRKVTNSNQTISYTYGSDGYRTSKIVNNNKIDYTYIDGKLIMMEGSFGELYFSYDDKGVLARVRYKNSSGTATNYYVLNNSRGDVEALYNTSGTLVARYTYDAWGNIISIKNSVGTDITSSTHIANLNPIRYRGYHYDSETGFYYLNSRYYNPEVGRFINADDASVITLDPTSFYDKNLYAYCDNNPVSRVDESGDSWILVGAAMNIALGAFTSYLAGEEFTIADIVVCGVIGGFGFSPYATPLLGAIVEGTLSFGLSLYKGESVDNAIINGATSATVSYFSFGTILDKVMGDDVAEVAVKNMTNLIFGTGTNLSSFCISTTLEELNSNKERTPSKTNKYQRGRRKEISYGNRFHR